MNAPLVSICCLTYNHAPFIRKCLEGFLMQQTNFPIEILIHDDCSTDSTTEIIREYEAKYPDLIFPLYEEENQYSRGGAGKMDLYNYRRARGKYIAYCEGDDYWTDPLKLQKQVDFMEANPEYSVCFHDFHEYDVRTGEYSKPVYRNPQTMVDGGVDVTPYMFLHHSYGGQPLTMLFRVSMYDLNWFTLYPDYKDTYEIYHLLRAGKGRYLDFEGGVYVRHDGGVATSSSEEKTCRSVLKCIIALYRNNADDPVIKEHLIEVLLWSHDVLGRKEFLQWSRDIPSLSIKVWMVLLKRYIKRLIKTA
jgi:glycosyltransferase involved in cell wall biosynthesis